MSKKDIKVVELFAGVGGFRLGFEGWKGKSASSNYSKALESDFEVVWSNQWEPSTKIQHANLVYQERWGKDGHSGVDINTIANNAISDENIKKIIPKHDLLVGGFPCQDYSVAGVNTKGIQGKKGVLWWSIHRILEARRPKYVLLENVDRLLKSPTSQRGRDFAIVLATMSDLGYNVEWKVINAADYGMPQRRRRVFIVGVHKSSNIKINDRMDWLFNDGILAESFPSEIVGDVKSFLLEDNVLDITKNFSEGKFLNSGVMHNKKVVTCDFTSNKPKEVVFSTHNSLGDVLVNHKEVATEFFVDNNKKLKKPLIKSQKPGIELSYIDLNNNDEAVLCTELDKWKYLKGRKAEQRTSSKGVFYYAEGPLKLNDSIELPARTIITSEGGPGASRFKHLVEIEKNKIFRRLTPIELERLNMFPDDHTKLVGISNNKRAFFMGNALVVGVVERVGKVLSWRINDAIS